MQRPADTSPRRATCWIIAALLLALFAVVLVGNSAAKHLRVGSVAVLVGSVLGLLQVLMRWSVHGTYSGEPWIVATLPPTWRKVLLVVSCMGVAIFAWAPLVLLATNPPAGGWRSTQTKDTIGMSLLLTSLFFDIVGYSTYRAWWFRSQGTTDEPMFP